MKRALAIAALLSVSAPLCAYAAQLSCYEEPGTRKHFCINEKAVTANGDTRASPVYSGGPNGVTDTGYILVTNCAKNVSTLQDRQGVNFSGGLSSSTPVLSSLSEWVGDVEKPRKNPKLRQF